MDEWQFLPSWRRGEPVSPDDARNWLVFALANSVGDHVIAGLTESGGTVRVVRPGNSYEQVGPHEYLLDPAEDSGYERLVEQLAAEDGLPEAVVHAWMADPLAPAGENEDELRHSLNLGVHSILGLVRALGKRDATRKVRIEIVTAGAHSVLGTERIRPAAAAVLGPTKVIPLEYPNVSCRAIDLPGGSGASEVLAVLEAELRSAAKDPIVSLRGRHRWLFEAEPIHAPAPSPESLPLKEGGVYLIVGGLGGVGLSIAEHLAKNYQAKLVLQSRSGRPDPSGREANPELGARLDALDRIETAAQEVLVVTADMMNEAEMRAAVASAEREMGPIDGVIVTAAVLDDAGAIHTMTRQDLERVVGTKVFGSLVVDRIFGDRPLDFLMFSSSMSTMLYHNRYGQVGYVTGNSFVEAFSLRRGESGLLTFTVAWDDFLEYGMSVRATDAFVESYGYKDITIMDPIHSFTPEEGAQVFERALAGGYPQVYISTTDLRDRMELDVTQVSPFLERALQEESAATGTGSVPVGDSAEMIGTVWRDLLGIEDIDANADFFELGGDSLQVARMAQRLSSVFQVAVPVNALYEAPTIAGLARLIDSMASEETTLLPDDTASEIVEGSL